MTPIETSEPRVDHDEVTVYFDKLPIESLTKLEVGEVLELRGKFCEITTPNCGPDPKVIREIERFVTYGMRTTSGELCVEIPKHPTAKTAVVRAARIVLLEDIPEEIRKRIETAELEANPPNESLAKMGSALGAILEE